MKKIVEALEAHGPLTGKELLSMVPMDDLTLWADCRRSEQVISQIVGRRYLRLDKRVEGYARLSPSIMREFYNYTVLGLAEQGKEVELRAGQLAAEIERISKLKFSLAEQTIKQVVESLSCGKLIEEKATFMIAGDVVYGMAHGEPRPEPSTGELVRGSDLDIIVVCADLPADTVSNLDAALYREKYRLLMSPAVREEIDSIIKDTAKVQEQLKFLDFKAMVASKILHEAHYLWGSTVLFAQIKELVKASGVPLKLSILEEKAVAERQEAELCLLQVPAHLDRGEALKLFLTAEEKEEIY